MENEPELIRDQMQETRTALTEKLDTLQQKVADTVESITTPVTETVQTVKEAVTGTVDSVKETVAGTVDSVRETVAGTVESVKDTFNLSKQVEQHPWPMMFGSLAAGFLLGRVLPSPFQATKVFRSEPDFDKLSRASSSRGSNGSHEPKQETPTPKEPGLLHGLSEAFSGELDKLKGLSVSVATGLLRDLMTQSMHGEIGDRVKQWMDGVTEKLGGKPLSEPLVTPEPEEPVQNEPRPSSTRRDKQPTQHTPRW